MFSLRSVRFITSAPIRFRAFTSTATTTTPPSSASPPQQPNTNTTTTTTTPTPATPTNTVAPKSNVLAPFIVPSSSSPRPFLFYSAPLEDISESAFRRLMFECGGADMTFSEMARVENLGRKSSSQSGSSWSKVRHHMIQSGPCFVQLLCGHEHSLRMFLDAFQPDPIQFAGFNLNIGCPSPAILAIGLGAQHIKRIGKTQKYVETLNEYIEKKCIGPEWSNRTKPTVSIKLRLGANEREKRVGAHVNLIRALNGNPLPKHWERKNEIAAGESTPAAVTQPTSTSASSGPVSHFILHGRHGKQHYETPNDFTAIAAAISASEATNIIANGDIHTVDQVIQCLDMGAAGVMIGRAAVKDPYIFSRLKSELLSERPNVLLQSPPTLARPANELRETYLKFAKQYNTWPKYVDNVSVRIGQPFEANPKIKLTERARVELQGRHHPEYDQAIRRDKARQRAAPKPYERRNIDFRVSMEQDMQDSVQG